MQVRSGDAKDLPDNLAEGEFGLTIDEGGLYIGAPRYAPIQYRGATLGDPGTFPYRNIKILTEFDTQYTITDETYYHGPLKSLSITAVATLQVITELMTFPDKAYGIYDYSITALDGSEPRRMGTFMAMTDGTSLKFLDTGLEFKPGDVTGVTLNIQLASNVLSLTATNLGGQAYVLQLSGRVWAAPVVPTP
jgi:hypothetical protein